MNLFVDIIHLYICWFHSYFLLSVAWIHKRHKVWKFESLLIYSIVSLCIHLLPPYFSQSNDLWLVQWVCKVLFSVELFWSDLCYTNTFGWNWINYVWICTAQSSSFGETPLTVQDLFVISFMVYYVCQLQQFNSYSSAHCLFNLNFIVVHHINLWNTEFWLFRRKCRPLES